MPKSEKTPTRTERSRVPKKTTKKSTKKGTTKSTKATKKSISAKNPKNGVSENFKIVIITLASVTCLFSVLALGLSVYNILGGNFSTPLINLGLDGNSANFTEGSIADIANEASKSVVSITTETRTYGYYGQDQTASAAGTGMIVTKDGYVLTNKHVIEGASDISVILEDGTKYTDVSLIATDPLNDVAFLKINGVEDLNPIELGDSKTITVGQQVVAIGNALGQFQNTVTVGIVSGTGRTITASNSSGSTTETLTDMIQTDASINAGNSGGPLVNAAGEVIGINTAVSSGNGIGFAIPISSIKGMLKNIIENDSSERAYLGVTYTNISADYAKLHNLPVSTGALVAGNNSDPILKDSPAEKAGIKDGDIITAVNGSKVGASGTLSSLLGEYLPGDTITLTIIRDNKEQNIKVTLEAFPKSLTKATSE